MHSSGQVIFAIPEVVVSMLSGIRIAGAATINPFFYLRQFDHIVFDEFPLPLMTGRLGWPACCRWGLCRNVKQRSRCYRLLRFDVTDTLGAMGIDRKRN